MRYISPIGTGPMKRQRSESSAMEYGPKPRSLLHVKPTDAAKRRTQELATAVPNVFYNPTERRRVSRSPTPPRRSAAHRRLPSDMERLRPDFMGDSEMEDAVLPPVVPTAKPSRPRHLPEPRGTGALFKSSTFYPSSQPSSSSRVASQLAPGSSLSRPMLSNQMKPSSKPIPAQPITTKADVDRHLMGQRLQKEIDRAGTPSTTCTPSTSASSTPSAQPSGLTGTCLGYIINSVRADAAI
jgi:hypothetical protein